MKEELGIDIEIVKLLPQIYSEVRERWQGIFICYLCRQKKPEEKIVLNFEASEYGWFTLEQISQMKCLSKTYEIAAMAKS
jgi:ADP-ribose pyrophosphatase YjhB (NUDIX family)